MKKIFLLFFLISSLFLNQCAIAEDAPDILLKAREEYYNGNFKRALTFTNNMVGQARNNAEVFTLRAQIKTELNDIKGALIDINRAIKLTPTVERYLLRAYLLARTNDETKISNILDDVFCTVDKDQKKRNFQIRYYCVIKILDDPNISNSMKLEVFHIMIKAFGVVCKRSNSLPMTMSNYFAFLIKYADFVYKLDEKSLEKVGSDGYSLSKLYTLSGIKAMIKEASTIANFAPDSTEAQALDLALTGLFEYGTGNKQKGNDLINKAKKKAKTVKTNYDGRSLSSLLEEMIEFSLAEINYTAG